MKPTWQTADGAVQLFLGDCLEVLPRLEVTVDQVLTDPPYSVSEAGSIHVGRNGDRRNLDFFEDDRDWAAMNAVVRTAAEMVQPISAEHASHYWWCGHRQVGAIVDAYESKGWKTKFLVWAKACPAPPPPWSGWPSGAELCVYAFRHGRKWRLAPADVPPSNVIVADSYRHGQPGKVPHPTQKPTKIMHPLIAASSDAGDLVLDCFMGSATTGVCCVRTGRRFIGIEKEPKYFEIAVRRIEAELNRAPLFEPKPQVQKNLIGDDAA